MVALGQNDCLKSSVELWNLVTDEDIQWIFKACRQVYVFLYSCCRNAEEGQKGK